MEVISSLHIQYSKLFVLGEFGWPLDGIVSGRMEQTNCKHERHFVKRNTRNDRELPFLTATWLQSHIPCQMEVRRI